MFTGSEQCCASGSVSHLDFRIRISFNEFGVIRRKKMYTKNRIFPILGRIRIRIKMERIRNKIKRVRNTGSNLLMFIGSQQCCESGSVSHLDSRIRISINEFCVIRRKKRYKKIVFFPFKVWIRICIKMERIRNKMERVRNTGSEVKQVVESQFPEVTDRRGGRKLDMMGTPV